MRKWALVLIIILGFGLRVMALDKFPSGFTPDEASFGYDAYSLLKTGKDQWGQSLPLVLKSFGDFKAPLYAYLDVPFIATMGLTKTAVRLPNVILGTLAILVTYLLVKKISERDPSTTLMMTNTALLAAFLLAISPWHIMMSRGAFEANLTTFFLTLAVYLLLSEKLIWAALAFGLNMLTYHAAKVVTPLVVAGTAFIFRDEILKVDRKKLFLAGTVFALFLAITGYTLLNGGATRAKDVNIFNGSITQAFDERQLAILVGENKYFAKLIHNKFTVDVQRFVGNYMTYFSPPFLFTHGSAEFTYGMIPGQGVLYWFELPFLVFFVVSFVKSKDKRLHYLILGWILVAPIPAALATGPGYAGNRAVIMLPAIQIALAIGLVQALFFIKNTKIRLLYVGFALVCIISFLESYFVVSPAVAAKDMLYGNLEVAQWLTQNVDKNTVVVIDKDLSEPHIYVAFANKWDPISYQKETHDWDFQERGLGWVDQLPEYKLGNYTFKTVHLKEYATIHGVILVGKPDDFPDGANIIKTIYYPNGKPAIVIVKT